MPNLIRFAILVFAIMFSTQPVKAESTLPLCETSTGFQGQLFQGFIATVIGPVGAKWAIEASSFNIEGGWVPLVEQTHPLFGSGVVTDFGIMVKPLVEGEVEIEFYDPDRTASMGTCRANVVQFDLETHGIDALRAGICPLSGDFDTPIFLGETRIFGTPTGLSTGYQWLDEGVVEFERQDEAHAITGLEQGVVNFMVNTREKEPFAERLYAICALEVTGTDISSSL